MDYSLIELQVEQGIATLTLNRPDKRNAMSDGMRTEFIHALEHITADKAIKALVLTGATLVLYSLVTRDFSPWRRLLPLPGVGRCSIR